MGQVKRHLDKMSRRKQITQHTIKYAKQQDVTDIKYKLFNIFFLLIFFIY